ncbi:uncharacterized protein LOC6560908 [Drosophila grimshawi]|uniref:GH21199 n=1 Tax=Drosophila grimshawi TaxID=7222 RepID=B4J724_DROGR|nr:uncharacterized protein LOC6560908 [Drosophila grimshawi]EDW01012.1 GH21199 [Drosophila grimshawi]
MYTLLTLLIVLLLLSLCWAEGSAQQQQQEKLVPLPTPPSKPGHYLHHLHGAGGWYMPDNSGKYRHEHKPYDGGYGDRGQPYANDLRGILRKAEEQLVASVQEAEENFALGPRDHLRFMIDFNYNGTGWQIIQFEWVRDGDDQRQFSYVNENRLWDKNSQSQSTSQSQPAQAYKYDQPQTALTDPDRKQQQSREEYEISKINSQQNSGEVQATINEVLEYIQQEILPTLN